MSCLNTSRSHAGWSPLETEQLFALAAEAQGCGRPLKAVFDEVAARSGRKPNSVRNYYYARVKESGPEQYAHKRAFLPFTDEEARGLVEQVLTAQAGGESVRSCTLRLAGGDDKAMLRYQNKYRALLKNNPALVREVACALAAGGKPTFDPYTASLDTRRAGRPRKGAADLARLTDRLAFDLSRTEGVNARGLVESLCALAAAALRGDEQPRPVPGDPAHALRLENDALRRRLERERERYDRLLISFRQLIRINSEFLSLNAVVKVSNLTSYIHDLESNVRTCELAMTEHAQ